MKSLLFARGFGDVWINQSEATVVGFASEFKQRCLDMDTQDWHRNVLDFSQFRTYRLCKIELTFESYLDMKLTSEMRNLLTRILTYL